MGLHEAEMKESNDASETQPHEASNPDAAEPAASNPQGTEARPKKKRKKPRVPRATDEADVAVHEVEQQPTVLPAPAKPKKKRKQLAMTEPSGPAAEPQSEIVEDDPSQSEKGGHKPAKKKKAKNQEKDEAGEDENEPSADKGTPVEAPPDGASHETNVGVDAKADSDCLKVCAANLPYWFDKTRIWRHFRRAGDVQHVWVLWDKWSGESKGIAFITFADEASVQAALEFDGTSVSGNVLRVNLATDKAEESKASEAGGWAGGGSWGQENPHYGQNHRVTPGKGRSKGKTRGAAGVLALADKPEGSLGLMARGLSFSVTEADLKGLFAKCGSGPTRVRVLVDKVTGESKGKAFIDFADEAALKQAVSLNDTVLKGRPLRLEFSRAAD